MDRIFLIVFSVFGLITAGMITTDAQSAGSLSKKSANDTSDGVAKPASVENIGSPPADAGETRGAFEESEVAGSERIVESPGTGMTETNDDLDDNQPSEFPGDMNGLNGMTNSTFDDPDDLDDRPDNDLRAQPFMQ